MVDHGSFVHADDPTMKVLDTVQNGMVYRTRTHCCSAPPSNYASNRCIVTLRTATGKNDLTGLASDHIGDDVT
jgi:hypothetical protein